MYTTRPGVETKRSILIQDEYTVSRRPLLVTGRVRFVSISVFNHGNVWLCIAPQINSENQQNDHKQLVLGS